MKLVTEKNQILKEVCAPFDFENPIVDQEELITNLQAVRQEKAGLGLSAPQLGINSRVFVIGLSDMTVEGAEDYAKAFFNPQIFWDQTTNTYPDNELTYMVEGCLSYPGMFLKIKRPNHIIMEWYTEEGEREVDEFSGMTSRILQHEIDHLNGVTFDKKASTYHLQQARRKLKAQLRARKRFELIKKRGY
jgi:peptide deformylase|tara:strand:+ start:1150 stop:1719 length:570 start_codon:yes stop_codon:yes gene_type:complete